jgi:chromosome segregation protein
LVYIKKIELRNFKTFGRKSSLTFDRGFTIITGPNGAGKSNIVDSVKFALGELSLKELRGATFSDLIFKSSPESSPKSAYVSIQFDNTDRRIPVDSDSVTISREFYRGGEGVCRLNGKRISRKQLTDILSSAGIHLAGYNIVPQHAVTRLAEVTPEERRKIIEDIVGIAVYEEKKAEAQAQLQQADLNIRVASARVDEVKSRVEALERERNDFLRYSFLKGEINRLKAKLLSDKIRQLNEEIEAVKAEIRRKLFEIESIKKRREELLTIRNQIESDRRMFEEEIVDKGGSELFNVERMMSDVNAQIASLKTEMEFGKANLNTLTKRRDELISRIKQLNKNIKDIKVDLQRLKTRREKALKALIEKEKAHLELSERIKGMRKSSGENAGRIEYIEKEMDGLMKQLVKLNVQSKSSSIKLSLLASRMKTLEAKRFKLQSLIGNVENRLKELSKLRMEEQRNLEEIEKRIFEYEALKEIREKEITEAKEVARKARISVVEFKSQRSLAETLAAEEKALAKIEEMGRAGAIPGIYGRLEDLIKFDENYRKAVEVASAGWMKALVVKDIETAITCIESLKRTKLGMIKIIPLENVASIKPKAKYTEAPEVIGCLADLILCDERLKPAVNFVFGDVVLARSQRAAFLSALEGVRAVVTTGDLYELGGGMKSGYYREPLNIEALIPKTSDLENLDKTVQSLELLIERRLADINRLNSEIVKLKESRIASQNMIEALKKEIRDADISLSKFKRTLTTINRRLNSLNKSVEKERESLSSTLTQRNEIQRKLIEFEREKNSLKIKMNLSKLTKVESEHSLLTEELNELKRQNIELDNKISTLESSHAALSSTLDQAIVQLKDSKNQIEKLTRDVEQARLKLNEANERLAELETKRNSLSKTLTSVRDRRSEFESELEKLERQLGEVFNKYESLNAIIAQLNTEVREKEMQLSFLLAELKETGHSEPIETRPEEVKKIEFTLNLLERELNNIGAVNQLAVQQYEDVKNNYKQLSVRINELEREKLSIVNFINELERKKHEAFMEAFNKVNEAFEQTFSKLTNGGSGRLILENPEDPFKGGIDLSLKFPGKPETIISSASGGEKSVATVSFILALQTVHPMPFYIFDEIDAHLDDVNAQRLADLLKERSKGSQFIVISLKDAIISRAERVYGIFVQEGTSQTVLLPKMEGT